MSRFKLLLAVILLLASSPAWTGESGEYGPADSPSLSQGHAPQFHPNVQRFLGAFHADLTRPNRLACGGVVPGGPAIASAPDDRIEDLGVFVLRMSSGAGEAAFQYIAELSRRILPAMVEVVGPPTAVETLTVELDNGPIQHYECGNHKIVMGTLSEEELASGYPGWDNLFIHELTHAFQKELLCGYPDYPSWLTEGMAEAARHFVSERASELAGDRDFTRRRFDKRMAVYDLHNSTGEQVLGGRGAIAYRFSFEFLYQNAAGSMIVPIYAELAAGRTDPHPLRRLTEVLRDEKNNFPVHMYEAMDRVWKTPIDGISPPSRWVRSRAVTCPSVRDGEFMLLIPPFPRNNVNPDGIVVMRFTRNGGAFQYLITTSNARFHGADGIVRSVPQQYNWIVPPENLPQGAYLVEMDEPGMESQTLSARTWILKVDSSFLGAFGEETLWEGIAVIFVDRNGKPVDIPDLSVDGRMIARVPGGVIAQTHSGTGGSLTFRGWGREIGTVSVTGALPRMVVIPVESTPPNCVVSWTPYHPKAGETVEVFLRKDLSSIVPADDKVWLVLHDVNRFVEVDRVEMTPTSDANVFSATLSLSPLTDYGLLEFSSYTSDHKGCLMSPCSWFTAYEFATHPAETQEIVRLRRDGTDFVVDVEGDINPEHLLLRLASSPDGPWMNQPTARRDTHRPSTLRWDVSGAMNEDTYFEVAMVVGNDDEVLSAGFLSSVPSLTTSVAYPVFPSPSAGPFRWQFDVAPPTKGNVTFRVYDVAGRLVHEQRGRTLLPGLQEFWWDGRVDGQRAPSGVYFLKSIGPGLDLTGRVVIVR